MKKEILKLNKKEVLDRFPSIIEKGVIHPIIVLSYNGEERIVKNGLIEDKTEVILLTFESAEEYNEFLSVYTTTGIDFSDDEFVMLKNVLPKIPIHIYNKIKNDERIIDYLLEFLK